MITKKDDKKGKYQSCETLVVINSSESMYNFSFQIESYGETERESTDNLLKGIKHFQLSLQKEQLTILDNY